MSKLEGLGKILYILLIPAGALIFNLASHFPRFIERVYSNGFYRLVSQPLSLATGVIPISLMEFVLIFLVIMILTLLLRTILRAVQKPRRKLSGILHFFMNIAVAGSVIYFMFIFLWGLNYNRLPFAEIASLDIRPASTKELAEVCESIILKANSLRDGVLKSPSGVMYTPGGYKDVFKRASKGFEKASQIYPELGGRYGNPKGITFSHLMSYTGISGVFFPFTGEANVDIAMPDLVIPSTAMHEMAHQRGFAREDEANYIAYLTCSMHPDTDFQYSGTVLALIYSMNALYSDDQEAYMLLRGKYSEGVLRDLQDHNAFWQRYKGPVEKISNSVNNAYLKANRQSDGVKSYGRMVDLLIAEHRKSKAG